MLNDDLSIFVALVEGGSFSNAAKNLHTTQATVSRRLKVLEDELKITLITRNSRNFEVTARGNQLYAAVKAQQNELNHLLSQLKNDDTPPSGKVKISLPIGLSYFIVSPYVAEFMQQHPKLELELVYQTMNVDIIKDNFDMAIIDYFPNQQTTLLRKLATFTPKLYCSKEYLERYGPPPDIHSPHSNYLSVGLSHNAMSVRNPTVAYGEMAEFLIAHPPRILSNNGLHNKAIVMSGHAIVYGWDFMFKDELANETIIQVLPEINITPFNVYLQRPNVHASPEVKLVIEFIEECFKRFSEEENPALKL